ncbi:MAG: hypothetical protein KC609_20465, partial [Myxococcales bacterium]|nr:hypothetical protein [Myxococcales bacterium]
SIDQPKHDSKKIASLVPAIVGLTAKRDALNTSKKNVDSLDHELRKDAAPNSPLGRLESDRIALEGKGKKLTGTMTKRKHHFAKAKETSTKNDKTAGEMRTKQGSVSKGSGDVKTVMQIAKNPVLRTIVKVGAGAGRVVGKVINAGARLLGRKTPVVDLKKIEKIKKVFDVAPKLDKTFSRQQTQSDKGQTLLSLPKKVDDAQKQQLDSSDTKLKQGDTKLGETKQKIDAEKKVHETRVSDNEKRRQVLDADEKDTEDALKTATTKLDTAVDENRVWTSGYDTQRRENENALNTAQRKHETAELEAERKAQIDQCLGVVQAAREQSAQRVRDAHAFAANRQLETEGRTKRPLPPAYQQHAAEILNQLESAVTSYTALFEQPGAELKLVTPSRVPTIVRSVERVVEQANSAIARHVETTLERLEKLYSALDGPADDTAPSDEPSPEGTPDVPKEELDPETPDTDSEDKELK